MQLVREALLSSPTEQNSISWKKLSFFEIREKMAKNTFSNAFRKIDVDQYNEDNFKEDENAENSLPAAIDENEVNSLLNQGKHIEALVTALQNAPLGSKNQQLKVSWFSFLSLAGLGVVETFSQDKVLVILIVFWGRFLWQV